MSSIAAKLTPILLTLLLVSAAAPAGADEDLGEYGELGEEAGRDALEPPDTSSPRATLKTFLDEGREAWTIFLTSHESRRERFQSARRRVQRAARCLDLSELPPESQDERAGETTILLLDVLERIRIPLWEAIPDRQQVEEEGLSEWTIPHTRITIHRVDEGPRAGEFLFTPHTVERALEFYERTRHLEPRSKAAVDDGYAIIRTRPGWMIPMSWIKSLPAWARADIAGQAVWQWLSLAVVLLIAGGVIGGLRRGVVRRTVDKSLRNYFRRALIPVAILILVYVIGDVAIGQIGLRGPVSAGLYLSLRGGMILAAAWLVILAGGAVAQVIVTTPRITPQSVDEHLVRMAARLLSTMLAILIVVEGARSLGLPVVGLLAGVGVGGLAVALAAQSTIENFIGSLTIFADRPVRVGDFCRFGDEVGTVEAIGLRSTRIRTLGRSVMTIPNAEFSRLRLDNFSLRDNNLFRANLSLRYETTPAQLRDALDRVRGVLRNDPRVLADPARVRLVEFGSHAFQLEIFAYVDSNDWDEFLAIREDLLLQIADAIEAAGTRLAIPAQTAYLASDPVGEPLTSTEVSLDEA